MFLLERRSNYLKLVHFIGIGGIGMSGIARIMHDLGYKVQGSDLSENANTQRLVEIGIKVFIGHHVDNLTNVSCVIVSSAITNTNPEIEAATKNRVPILKRAKILSELMKKKCSISVSGSHGKTTTTALVASVFESEGIRPTVINGGVIKQKMASAYTGKSSYLIAEADESDATFINVPSTIVVVTNIDSEHTSFYKGFRNLVNSFRRFITNIPFYGFAVLCLDHPVVRRIFNQIEKPRIITYGIKSEDVNIRAYNIKYDISSSTFDVGINLSYIPESKKLKQILIPIPGEHNVLNSLAALAVGLGLGFNIKSIVDGLKYFTGVERRFTKVCEYNGADIIDDYAHHPVEVKATLATAKSIAQKRKGKVIAIFQPHRYSRVRDLFNEFTQCFSDSDKLYMLDIYPAGETPITGVTSQSLIREIAKTGLNAEFIANSDDISKFIRLNANRGDLVIMMGAGSISDFAYELIKKFTTNG